MYFKSGPRLSTLHRMMQWATISKIFWLLYFWGNSSRPGVFAFIFPVFTAENQIRDSICCHVWHTVLPLHVAWWTHSKTKAKTWKQLTTKISHELHSHLYRSLFWHLTVTGSFTARLTWVRGWCSDVRLIWACSGEGPGSADTGGSEHLIGSGLRQNQPASTTQHLHGNKVTC